MQGKESRIGELSFGIEANPIHKGFEYSCFYMNQISKTTGTHDVENPPLNSKLREEGVDTGKENLVKLT